MCTIHWTERWGHGHQYHDYHLQYSSDWCSQWDTWEGMSQEKAMGHQRCSQPLWWEEKFEEEAVRSRRSKRIQGSKQEDSEGSEESKGGLDRCSVRGDTKITAREHVSWWRPEKQGRSSTIQYRSGKCLTEEKEILSRWTEYCSVQPWELWQCSTGLQSAPGRRSTTSFPWGSWECSSIIEKGEAAGVNNIPTDLVQAGGETMIDVLTEICNRIWRTGERPIPWTQSLIITLHKKGNLWLCQNYRTISHISHSSKIMKVILNWLKPQAEEIIAEKQAGLRAGRSTTEQIFNFRIMCEKYLQHQQNQYHVCIDFKNIFDGLMGPHAEVQ